MARVAGENFAERLLRTAEQAAAIKRGERAPARVSRHEITAREAQVTPLPRYTASDVQRIRGGLRLSQTVFAQMLNVSASSVRAWERGAREPDGPTLRLLEIAERQPEALLSTIQSAASS